MDETTVIEFTDLALRLRTVVNVCIFVFCGVLAWLFTRYAYQQLKTYGYKRAEWQAKGAIGMAFMCLGEMARSGTIWEILVFKGAKGTYMTDVVPLMLSLVLIVIGALCAIRVFSPSRWGNIPWITSLFVVLVLSSVSWAMMD
jgi:hypothetical protein